MTDTPTTTPPAEPIVLAEIPPLPPKKSWHDNKLALIGAAALVGLLIGGAVAAGENASADAKANTVMERAEAKRDRMLDGVDDLKAGLQVDVDRLEGEIEELGAERARLAPQVTALRKELGKLTREKAMNSFEGVGIYLVGSDVRTGTYKAPASPGCYYALLRNLDGGLDSIIDNNNVDGPVVVRIAGGAKAIEVNNCGTFTRVGG